MHMILIDFHRVYLKLIPLSDLLKGYLQPLCQIPPQYYFPVLRGPYHVILQIINRMTCSFNWAHAQLIPCLFAFGEPVFIHPASWVVFNRVFYKRLGTNWFIKKEETRIEVESILNHGTE